MTSLFKKISTWRERIGQTAEFPLHLATDVERAMVAEIADLRAAGGNAQTSAAVDAQFGTLENWLEDYNSGRITQKDFINYLNRRATQLAGSTVPGDQVNGVVEMAGSAAPGAPTDQERADFEHWYVTHIDGAEIGSAGCAARWSAWPARSGGFYKAPSDWLIAPMPWGEPATPTAQQRAADDNARGLTTLLQASGAMRLVRCHDGSGEPFAAYDKEIADRVVADLRAEMHAMEDARAAAPDAGSLESVLDRAAAPLRKVQSEAMDEAPIECWSADQENFNATELDSVLTAHEELKPGDTVWVGEAVTPESHQLIDADDIMTTMGERAYEIAGEYAEDYPDVSKEAEQELDTLLAAWIGKHARPSFWTVTNIRPYVLSHDDFPNDLTPVQCDVPADDQQAAKPAGA